MFISQSLDRVVILLHKITEPVKVRRNRLFVIALQFVQ